MELYLKSRPIKKPFPLHRQLELREKAIEEITKKFLRDDAIIKIFLIGSSVKGNFGEYEPPGFRNSLFSDFDFIFLVKDHYPIPHWLKREPAGRPFAQDELNLAYRNPKMIEDRYDVEIFFVREKSFNDPKIVKEAEEAGIPLSEKSKHKHLEVHCNI